MTSEELATHLGPGWSPHPVILNAAIRGPVLVFKCHQSHKVTTGYGAKVDVIVAGQVHSVIETFDPLPIGTLSRAHYIAEQRLLAYEDLLDIL